MRLNSSFEQFSRFTQRRKTLFNAAITNLLKESIMIAKSYTFGHGYIADLWEYQTTQRASDGLIVSITIRNTLPQHHSIKGASAIWSMLEHGRKRYTIKTDHKMRLPIMNKRGYFGVFTSEVFEPSVEGHHPLERAKNHFIEGLNRFTAEILASNLDRNPNKQPITLLPNLYNAPANMKSQEVEPRSGLAYGSFYRSRPEKRESVKLAYKSYLKSTGRKATKRAKKAWL